MSTRRSAPLGSKGVACCEIWTAPRKPSGWPCPAASSRVREWGGLPLGGGFGWLSRKYGLAIDNLLSAEVVTADGRRLRASERENADLFWGLRGGGGNFGVVTEFEFRLHEVGPEVYAGLVVQPFEAARDYLRFHREFVADGARRPHRVAGHPPGSAAALSPRECPRKVGRHPPLSLPGRPCRGRTAHQTATHLRPGARRTRRHESLHGLAERLRRAGRSRRAQLLEGSLPYGVERRRDRHGARVRPKAPLAPLATFFSNI